MTGSAAVPARRGRPVARAGDALTDREAQVLLLTADGLQSEAIGRRLALSPDTVKSHLRRVYAKLGAVNAAHAVALGFKGGLLAAGGPRRAPAVSPGMPARYGPGGSVLVRREALGLLEACAHAALSGHGAAAAGFARRGLAGLAGSPGRGR